MNELDKFVDTISKIYKSYDCGELDIDGQRLVIRNINEFLFSTYEGIGETTVNDITKQYFSDYHKFWSKHHKEILDASINDEQCKNVARVLHEIYMRSEGRAFYELFGKFDIDGLTQREICLIRFLTANQDFRTSLKFGKIAEKYKINKELFNIKDIYNNPKNFLSKFYDSELSQGDKRLSYAKKISEYLLSMNCEPYELIEKYNYDVLAFKEDLINGRGAGSGFGSKKANMFIRDMYVTGIWKNLINIDKIDVASDVNTISIALRTGILESKMPLVASFLDIFSYQYSLMDQMNEIAWRRVWNYWNEEYSDGNLESPCLIDFFIYEFVGRNICRDTLVKYECGACGKIFYRNNAMTRICENKKCKSDMLHKDKMLPCVDEHGIVVIEKTDFYSSNICSPNLSQCPFSHICTNERKKMKPPKSISIMGRTGWSSSYSNKGYGGGGPMA